MLAELVAQGMKLQDIGDRMRTTRASIASRLRVVGVRGRAKRSHSPDRPAKMPDRKPREWTAEEDALLTGLHAQGQPMWKIAKALHVATTTASMRARVIGLMKPASEALPFRPERFACGHCGTRSDASLDFGCGHCLPLRRSAA